LHEVAVADECVEFAEYEEDIEFGGVVAYRGFDEVE
jgi:hypothetical protein